MNIKTTFRALNYRNYRLFFFGQGISLIGTWMQTVALGWLVYRLTNSPLMLGLVGFSSQIFMFVLTPIAGVFADRHNPKKILLATQTLSMLQAAILAALVLSGRIQAWHILVLSSALGLINSFDIPTRQSFVIKMVDKREDLGNAIALNSSMFNVARLIGPSIAGVTIAVFGEGVCFLINAVSFIAVIISLAAMNIPYAEKEKEAAKVFEGLKEGVRYAYGFKPIRYVLINLALVSMAGNPYMILMPVMARDILHGGPHAFGFLVGAAGVGAFIGAIYLASRKTVVGLFRVISAGGIAFGCALVLLSLSRTLALSMAIMLAAGFGMIIVMASSNTILQTVADDDKRGRVMSLYAMAFGGIATFGNLLAGVLASKIGTTYTILGSGLICILGAVIFAGKRPAIGKILRPIYIEKGIISEIQQ